MIEVKKIDAWVPFILMLGLGLDAGGELGIRSFFVIFSALALVLRGRLVFPRYSYFYVPLLLFYPALLLVGAGIGVNKIDIAISQYMGGFFGFVLIVYFHQYKSNDLMKMFYKALFVVAIVVNAMSIGLIFGIPIFVSFVGFLSESRAGYFGLRMISDDFFAANIYFKSTLFFPAAFVIALFYRNFIAAAVLFAACLFSISKVGVLLCLVSLLFFLVNERRLSLLMIFGGLCALLMPILVQSAVWLDALNVLSGDSQTLTVRELHLASIVDLFSNNSLNLLFGFGLGSEFYSLGAGKYVSNIEIDHFNTIRKYGLIWSLVFFFGVGYAALKLWTQRACNPSFSYMAFALVMTFMAAGTNPVLISPLFFVLLSIAHSLGMRPYKYD